MILTKASGQPNKYEHPTFKQIILKGKKTGQTRYMIVLDEDDDEDDEQNKKFVLDVPVLS